MRSKQDRLIADRLWELIEPLISPRPPAKGPGGWPRIDELSDAAVIDWSRGCIDAVAVRANRGAS